MNAHATVAPRRILPTLLATCLAAACSSAPSDTSWEAQRRYGAQMARQGFWREAAFRFEKAAAQRPDDAKTQNDLAVSYEGLGETAKALEAYKRALALEPGNPQIKRNYARFAEYYTSVQRAAAGPSAPAAPAPATPTPPPATGVSVIPPATGAAPNPAPPATPEAPPSVAPAPPATPTPAPPTAAPAATPTPAPTATPAPAPGATP